MKPGALPPRKHTRTTRPPGFFELQTPRNSRSRDETGKHGLLMVSAAACGRRAESRPARDWLTRYTVANFRHAYVPELRALARQVVPLASIG
jgi:hypothetical protein